MINVGNKWMYYYTGLMGRYWKEIEDSDDTNIYQWPSRITALKEVVNQFIRNKARDYNRNGDNNVSYDKNDIKELLLPNINIDNIKEYCSEYKHLIFFSGCVDGSTFIRFNSEEKRDQFLDKLTEFESFEDLFFHEQEDFILYYFN